LGFLLLGLGGALGSITRFILGNIISKKANTNFPIGTFLINITGAVLLGLVIGIHAEGNMYLLMADGFLGAYTTFGAFMFEGVTLFLKSKKISALYYISGTVILGILGYFSGYAIGKLI